jgi:hypothetical protein
MITVWHLLNYYFIETCKLENGICDFIALNVTVLGKKNRSNKLTVQEKKLSYFVTRRVEEGDCRMDGRQEGGPHRQTCFFFLNILSTFLQYCVI